MKVGSYFLILIFLSSIANQSIAQSTDSIEYYKTQLASSGDIMPQQKATILRKISYFYLLNDDLPNASKYANEALAVSQKHKLKEEEGEALSNISNVIYAQGNSVEALRYLGKAMDIFTQLNDDQNLSQVYVSYGKLYYSLGEYPKAIDYILNSFKYIEKYPNKQLQANALSILGLVRYSSGSNEQAVHDFNKSLVIFKQINNKFGIANCYNNLGLAYTHLKYYKIALNNFALAGEVYDELGNDLKKADVGTNMAFIYIDLGKPKEALNLLMQSAKIQEKHLAKNELATTYNNIGDCYSSMGNYSLAKSWIHKSLEISLPLDQIYNTTSSYYSLYEIDSLAGNYGEALKNYILFSEHKDIIFNEDKTKELTQIEMTYEFQKTEDSIRLVNDKELAIRDAVIKTNRREKVALFGGSFLLFIIGAMLFYQNKQRKKNNDKLREINAELDEANRIKMRFFSILNHDLRSPVSSVLSFVRLQQSAGDAIDDETKNRLQAQTISSAENLLNSMEDLLLWSKGQMEQFKPVYKDVAVSKLFEDTQKHFQSLNNVSMVFENPEDLTLHTDVDYLKTIVRNLTANAVKAMGQKEGSQIIWRAWSEGNDRYLSITDNGPGGTEEQFRALYDETATVGIKTGLGLHLIRDLAKAIDCKVAVQSNQGEGTKIKLQFMPIESKRAA